MESSPKQISNGHYPCSHLISKQLNVFTLAYNDIERQRQCHAKPASDSNGTKNKSISNVYALRAKEGKFTDECRRRARGAKQKTPLCCVNEIDDMVKNGWLAGP